MFPLQQVYDELKKILAQTIEPTIFLDDEGKNFTVSPFDLGMEVKRKLSIF